MSTYDEDVAVFWRAVVGRFIVATRERIEREQAAGRCDASLDAHASAFALVWMTERTLYELMVQPGQLARETLMTALATIWERSVFAGA